MNKRIAVLGLALAASGCLADLRPDDVAQIERPAEDNEAKGHALLARAAQAQGVESFRGYETYQMTATDTWKGMLARAGNPWPQAKVDLRLSYRTDSFDGRAEFLAGKKEGWTWGLQSWKTYEVTPDGELEFKKNKDAKFILPALQYLIEFVFRDHRDKVVTYAGTETIGEKSYELVYVTWSSMEPAKTHDQFVAYIDPTTGMMDKLAYTIRDFAGFVKGAIHYEDMRDVAGVKMPFRMSITGKASDSPDKFLHRVEASKVEFGVPSVASFRVDEQLTPIGDQKVATR